jgi:5-methylthioadenosine/S-adenosylhomocysteine deaminase
MIDILINHVMIITVDAERRVYMDGSIAINHGEIVEVGPADSLDNKYQAQTILEAAQMIAMPGMINCHMHLAQVMMRGVNDNVEVMDKLKNYIWPIQGHYDEQDALVSAKLALLEMIKSGTTAFISTGLHPRYGIDNIAQLILDAGMRAALSKYVMDIPAYALDKSALHPGMWETGAESMRQARDMIQKWHGAGQGRLQAWFSPRSVGGCSPELLQEVSRLADEFGVGITAHWAEVQNNVDYTVKTYGLLPAEFARSVGLLSPRVTFAHGICFEDSEIELLAETGTHICHCPVTNAKLAMGVAKVPRMLRRGVNVCLGNDGMPVNNTADMFREMRTALLMHRNNEGDPCYPTAAEAIEMATLNGARALMLEDRIGSLEVGKRADIILINTRKPHLYPLHDPVSAVAWAANGSDVDTVIIDGRLVMQGRQVLTLDEVQILDEVMERQVKILQQAGVTTNPVWPWS